MRARLNYPNGCIQRPTPQQWRRANAKGPFTALHTLTALTALALCACGALESPRGKNSGPALPDPIPNPRLIMSTFPSVEVDILGLPGAFLGEGTLRVKTSRGTFETRTAPDGSFVFDAAPISGPEVVTLTFADEEPFSFKLVEGALTPEWSPTIVVSVEAGLATFSLIVEPGQMVIAANPRTGTTVAEVNEGISQVSIFIPGQSGDAIRLYLRADDESPLWGPLIRNLP